MTYIVWTLRRTGGTSLAELIFHVAGGPRVGHEPFNIDRAFGDIHRAFNATGDREALAARIEEALGERPPIKHCHELVPVALNATLLDVSTRLGYRHLILDRHDEVGRLLSLELARLTGVWGKMGSETVYDRIVAGELTLPPIPIETAVEHQAYCAERRATLAAQFAERGITPPRIHFEEVFGPDADGEARIDALMAELGLDVSTVADYGQWRHWTLHTKGQDSRRILPYVPNLAEARRALEAGRASPGRTASVTAGNVTAGRG